MVSALSHIREIERVAMGGTSDRDRPVIQSWLRCLNDYQLNPARTHAVLPLSLWVIRLLIITYVKRVFILDRNGQKGVVTSIIRQDNCGI